MTFGTLQDLQEALGGVGKSYACALKKASGAGGTRVFDVKAVMLWKRNNPGWKVTDVYPNRSRQRNPKGRRAATAGKSDAQS